MTWKTRLALMFLTSAFLTAPIFAQTTTPTAPVIVVSTVQPTSAAEATESVPREIILAEDETQTIVGALTFVHPKTWFATPGPEDKVLLTNIDLMSLVPGTDLPLDSVLAQIQIFSISQLAATIGPIVSPAQIFEAVPSESGEPAALISEVTVDGVVLGRADFSKESNENIIYIRLIDDKTFLLAVLASRTLGDVVKNEAVFQRAFATLQLDDTAPFVEDLSRYDSIVQTFSPEGFPQLGSADAPVKIVEVGSFDCPVCRSFHDLALPILLERIQRGEVQYTYIPVFGTGHLPRGQRAAIAAMCAADQGQFWQYQDGLFGWQDFGPHAFLDVRLQNGAAALGLDMTIFIDCLQNLTKKPVLDAALAFVQTLPEFNGTPNVLLNGVTINWSRLPTTIDEAVLAASLATPEVAPATVEATAAVETTASVEITAPTATATTQP